MGKRGEGAYGTGDPAGSPEAVSELARYAC